VTPGLAESAFLAQRCLSLGQTLSAERAARTVCMVRVRIHSKAAPDVLCRGKTHISSRCFCFAQNTLQIVYNNRVRVANVLFYFYLRFGDARYPLAMLRLFSLPDEGILAESSDTVHLCDPLDGPEGLVVVPVTAICSVVAMFPETAVGPAGQMTLTGKFSLMRHAYIDLATFSSDGLFEEDYDNV
jgi:hypothetical protein